jgi:hypothetical protein
MRRFTILAAVAAAALLATADRAAAQWGYGYAYRNPWTGGTAWRAGGVNAWTGAGAWQGGGYNPWTGNMYQSQGYVNPWTGTRGFVNQAYNPWTNQYRYRWGVHPW